MVRTKKLVYFEPALILHFHVADVTPELGKETEIQKELSDIGVNYLHRNEDLIAENVIEARRLEAIIKVNVILCCL